LAFCPAFGERDYRDGVRLSAEPLPEIISKNGTTALQSNRFDCAAPAGLLLGHCVKAPYFIALGLHMFEAVAAFLIVLSVGIFVAHALDAYWS
jgi:hypothetical protein